MAFDIQLDITIPNYDFQLKRQTNNFFSFTETFRCPYIDAENRLKDNPFIIFAQAYYNLDNCEDNENAVQIMRHMSQFKDAAA